MIVLLTGAIGTGKTTYATDKLMQHDEDNKNIKNGELDKVRNIYSNISGLKVDHQPLPDDWRTTPKNSILAIDECHKIDIYKPTRKVLHDDERIVALNESRHDGYDFYFILNHQSFCIVRGLVNQHFHFHNPMGLVLLLFSCGVTEIQQRPIHKLLKILLKIVLSISLKKTYSKISNLLKMMLNIHVKLIFQKSHCLASCSSCTHCYYSLFVK
jgi:hypothetical protein